VFARSRCDCGFHPDSGQGEAESLADARMDAARACATLGPALIRRLPLFTQRRDWRGRRHLQDRCTVAVFSFRNSTAPQGGPEARGSAGYTRALRRRLVLAIWPPASCQQAPREKPRIPYYLHDDGFRLRNKHLYLGGHFAT
jgi:hypothetical protein